MAYRFIDNLPFRYCRYNMYKRKGVMASCEKCWGDAYTRMRCDPSQGQADHYSDLISERADDPCTPEEQAGEDAKMCPKCNRKTIHQMIGRCTNCYHEIN